MCLSTVGDVYSSIGFRNLIKDDVLVVEWLWVSLHKSLIIGMRNHLLTLSCSKVQILWEGHTIKYLTFFWKHLCRVRYIFWPLGSGKKLPSYYVLCLFTFFNFTEFHIDLVECTQSSEKNIDIKDVFLNPLLSIFLVLLRISEL